MKHRRKTQPSTEEPGVQAELPYVQGPACCPGNSLWAWGCVPPGLLLLVAVEHWK